MKKKKKLKQDKINTINNNDTGNWDNIYDVASHNEKWHGWPLYVTRFLLSKSDQIIGSWPFCWWCFLVKIRFNDYKFVTT